MRFSLFLELVDLLSLTAFKIIRQLKHITCEVVFVNSTK